MTWENGENLLGEDAKWYLERQTDTDDGCIDGVADVADPEEVSACASEWVFFNINGASEYVFLGLAVRCFAQQPSPLDILLPRCQDRGKE